MGLPWDAYYVLTKAEARLTNSKIHPNSGAPDYNITHLHEDMNEADWSAVEEHDPRYFTQPEVLELVAGAGFSFFLSATAEGVIANYNLMYDTDQMNPDASIAVVITADDTLIKAFVTETGQPTFTVLTAGTYLGHFHLSATTAGRKDTRIYWELYKRASGGAETLLITSEESAVLTDSDTAYEIHGALSADQTLLATDRLVLKIYGNQDTGIGGDATATLAMEGHSLSRVSVQTHFAEFDARYLFIDGSNADTTLDIGSENFTTTGQGRIDAGIGIGVDPTSTLPINAFVNANARFTMNIENSNSGNAAWAGCVVLSDTNSMYVLAYSSTITGTRYGVNKAGANELVGVAGPLLLGTQAGGGDISIGAGGTLAMTIDSTDQTVTVHQDLTVNGSTVILDSLPTSDPGNDGQLWNNAGNLQISEGS